MTPISQYDGIGGYTVGVGGGAGINTTLRPVQPRGGVVLGGGTSSQNTVIQTTVRPGNPIESYTVNNVAQRNRNRVFVPALTGMAAGAYIECLLGTTYDIVDGGATALAINIVQAITPEGEVIDLYWLKRLRAEQPWLKMYSPGIWRLSNVSAAAVPANVAVAFFHVAPPGQLTV